MASQTNPLAKAVNDAMQSQTAAAATETTTQATASTESGETTKTSGTETGETTSGTSTETTESTVEVEETPAEVQAALAIYRQLKDPKTAKAAAEFIATEAGIIAKKTGQSQETAKDVVLEILTETLGEENALLVEKLAPAINKILETKVEKPSREKEIAAVAKAAEAEMDSALSEFYKSHADYKDVEVRMVELMAEIGPGPRATPKSYLERLYKEAKAEKTSSEAEKNKKVTTVTKVQKNASETVRTVSSGGEPTSVATGSNRPSAREAVLAAAKEQGLV